MAAWYYLTKAMKNNKANSELNIIEFFHKSPDDINDKKENINSKCRICLQSGTVEIYNNENANCIIEALQNITEIVFSEYDDRPKALCDVCYKFINTAIAFKKTAKRSDEILKMPLKEEIFADHSEGSNFGDHDYFGDDDIPGGTKTHKDQWNTLDLGDSMSNVKTEKKEKIKYSCKVTCQICNKIVSQSYYKDHITMHDPDQNKYVCEFCGKSFRLRCAYHNHSLRHRSDFPYKCTLCPYRGRYKELLKTHMRTHSGDYRYMCTECPARFIFKTNLNSHMLKHKEPQYKCDACKRAFHTPLRLQRHFDIDHLGIRNHVCNMCGKAFGYRNAMMKHQRRVHKREKSLFGRMPSYLEAEHKKQNEDMQQLAI